MWHFLQHLLGTDDPAGHWYNFWSGFGADLGEVAFLGAAVGVYRKHNCHIRHCWRIAKQEVEGTSWRVCHIHHPRGRPTVADIAEHHERMLQIKDAQVTVLHDQAQRIRDRERDPESHPQPVEIVGDVSARRHRDPDQRTASSQDAGAQDI